MGSFLGSAGRAFGTKQVHITPGVEAPGRTPFTVEAMVQPKLIFFEVDVPVFSGDRLEWDDPRGGRSSGYVTEARVYDQGSRRMQHIEVEYSSRQPATERLAATAGHVIVVNGNNVNVAVGGSAITQQVPVTVGFEHLADTVGRALAVIEETKGIDPDEVDLARESATLIVSETSKSHPDRKVLKRLIPALKGVLTSAANAGAGSAASGLIDQLFIGA